MELRKSNAPQKRPIGHPVKEGAQESSLLQPCANVKEKIILLVDTSYDMGLPFPATQTRGRPSTKLQYIKKALDIYLHSKSSMNASHEYALLVLQDEVVVCYQEFTRNIQLLLDIIYDLEPTDEPAKIKEFSLDPVLEQIDSLVQLPSIKETNFERPSFVVRTVFIFGRSQSELTASERLQEKYELLQESPYFFFDVLYISDESEDDTIIKSNLDFLHDLDLHGKYYILQACRKVTEIFDSLAKLLSHPLQRCCQEKADYNFMPQVDVASNTATVC